MTAIADRAGTGSRTGSGRRVLAIVVLAMIGQLASSATAQAQDRWPVITIRGGGLIADVASKIEVDSSLGQKGTEIDLEDDLGFDSQATTFFVAGEWRISRRNRLLMEYTNMNRDVSHVNPSRTFTFRDQTFTVDTQVDAFVDTWFLAADYGFAFVANPTTEFGVSVGATVLSIRTGVQLAAAANGTTSVSRDLADHAEVTLPVPLPGLFLTVRPSSRIELGGRVRVIKASIDKLDGTMWEARAGGDFIVTKNIGIGAAYYWNRSKLDRNGKVWNGSVDYDFNGPQVALSLRF